MKVALVHDYIKEYGGAERVLEALSELYPDAPIYTAFYNRESNAYKRFQDKNVITSWAQNIPLFDTKLHSPLRFLAPFIWGSFDFSSYDVVITSAAWYITKGVKKGKNTKEFCYCHTPPRWLYGYKTAVELQKYLPVKMYAAVVGHFMRLYDFKQAQRVDYFIANSKEVQGRIKKFYRRDATVIYPPVSLPIRESMKEKKPTRDYYFIVSRLAGAKGIDVAIKAAQQSNITVKIAGAPTGYGVAYSEMQKLASKNVEFLGHVSDDELVTLYYNAKAFLALGTDEDFGITPVEAMLCGTPVIAYDGGGYKESVVDGKTGVFFKEATAESLLHAIKRFEKIEITSEDCRKQAEKFSKERFKKEIQHFIEANG